MNTDGIPPNMKLSDAYRLAIETGMKNDPRPKAEVEKVLSDARKQYDEMEDDKKQYFDQERLWNPYADSRFSWGDGEKDVASWQHHIDVFVDKHVLNWFDDFMAKSIECAPDPSFGIEYATFARIGSLVTKEIVTESRSRAR